jgi:hypothetical protein
LKIVKVVHAISEEDIFREKQSLMLNNYNIDEFINRNLKALRRTNIDKSVVEQMIDENEELKRTSFLEKPFIGIGIRASKIFSLIEGELAIRDIAIFERSQRISKILLEDLRTKADSFADVISIDDAREMYPCTKNLSIGTYTLHPYNSNMLTSLESFHKKLALEKDNELIVLLGRMGAKTVRIIDVSQSSSNGASKVSGNVVKVNACAEVSIENSLNSEQELIVEYEGNVVEIPSNLLAHSIWHSSSELKAIFNSRRFNKNPLHKYTLKNTYTETYDFDFDLAAKYLFAEFDLKAEYNTIKKRERLFEVQFARTE